MPRLDFTRARPTRVTDDVADIATLTVRPRQQQIPRATLRKAADDALAAFLANGGQVKQCAPAGPPALSEPTKTELQGPATANAAIALGVPAPWEDA